MPVNAALPDIEQSDIEPTPCPACKGRLYPRLLKCADCGLEVTTRYASNEFADLEPDQLHLLRIFVLCEGHIRDMEAALGVSYPTVKARLQALRARLGLSGDNERGDAASASPPPAKSDDKPALNDVGAVLSALEKGSIDYDAAMRRIRELRGR